MDQDKDDIIMETLDGSNVWLRMSNGQLSGRKESLALFEWQMRVGKKVPA